MKSYLVIGMGEFGKHLAIKLTSLKNEVCVVDTSNDVIDEMSKIVTRAFVGDCMKKSTLDELGINNYDAVIVAIGKNFQASLEITSNLKEMGAKHIIAKAVSDIQSKFLKMAGADETVYPERDIAEKVAIRCGNEDMMDFIEISDEYNIVELKVPEEWIDKSIVELNIRKKYNVTIVVITNNNNVTMPDAEYVFKQDDFMFVVGRQVNIEKLIKNEI